MTQWWKSPAWEAGAPLPIIVKMRQSNCGGQEAMPTTPDETVPRSDILTYHLRINPDPWLISVDPLHYRPLDEDDGLFPGPSPGNGRLAAGGEVEMGVRLVGVHQRPCAIATVWKGATGWTDWRPDLKTGLTSQALRAVEVFVDRLADLGWRAYVAAVVFTGGEAEAAVAEQAADMQGILEAEAARWRAHFGHMPWVVDQVRSDIDRDPALLADVRAGLAAAVAADPLMRLVDTSGCELLPDSVHYTADGLATKGALDADAIADMPEHSVGPSTHVRGALYASEALAREVARAFRGHVRKAPIDDLWAACVPVGKHWIPLTWSPA